MAALDKTLLERVARCIAQPGSAALTGANSSSILRQSAASYGSQRIFEEATVPTGFDPQAAVLFEAVVEAAFLIATSDGVFDDDERAAFESVVAEACDHNVQVEQLEALLHDFREQLSEDGMEKRTRTIGRAVRRRDHQIEVLRIAALVAHISGGVSEHERSVLEQLARGFDLPAGSVDHALMQAEIALQGQVS
jgi:tellurite resistance protein